ncbi:Vps51/Vps67-domain-containing protein [Collybia nuda]|uniref:Vacuolar protein sorting-associated protein 51 homolog n=1 Tax=Collybia nuda TaxID=64659 RepID=A0A9P6CIU6_9AGAR|nr:Vps51/Vps67-domain-containing protein [Collybia nuda]
MSSTSSPDRRKSLIPRPPPSSLRPSSPSPSTPTTPNAKYTTVTPHATSIPLSSRHSAPPTPPPQKSRARDLLRKHYGLGVGPPPPLPGKAADLDPMNLDSTAFDAKNYYEQLITTSSLPNLLKKENELLIEIRELDSERQSLVYNHHHELIAASDTIAAMKTRAESLDADLDLLKVAFSEISRLASEIATETPQPVHSQSEASP